MYQKACKDKSINIGKLLVTKESSILGGKLIVNFPTKTDWRKPSEYSYIEEGLKDLVRIIRDYKIDSIAIPPLGAGNGGLNWSRIKMLIDNYLSHIDAEVFVYTPNAEIAELMKSERVKW